MDFIQYLVAKKEVDDRALNPRVWQCMARSLAKISTPHLLEVGGGIGSMFLRLVERRVLCRGAYTLVDTNGEAISYLPEYLYTRTKQLGLQVKDLGAKYYHICDENHDLKLRLVTQDLFEYLEGNDAVWDGLIAHAVLDLLPLERALSSFRAAVRQGGFLYLSLNYDGLTAFLPQLDTQFEARLLGLYDRSMDERDTGSGISGGSKTGRHLLEKIPDSGMKICCAGSSDWVLYPRNGEYEAGSAEVLRALLDFIEDELRDHPQIAREHLDVWLAQRRSQIASCQLRAIVHHLDFVVHRL